MAAANGICLAESLGHRYIFPIPAKRPLNRRISRVSSQPTSTPTPMTLTKWLIVLIAIIGFAFDIYELLMLPLIIRPALAELAGARPGDDVYSYWFSWLFFAPAVAGGIFGLLGGYLTDRLGRRRVLTGSILLYAFSAFFAGFSTSLPMLVILRCTTFIGVCVEFVAAIAWLAELFPEPRQREKVLGYTQAFSSFGGLLVAVANSIAIGWSAGQAPELFAGLHLPALQLPPIVMPDFLKPWLGNIAFEHMHEPWRYTLMSGLIPAIPLILIRPFLPESPVWQQKKTAGTLRRPSIRELFAPHLRKTTVVTTIMIACAFGAAFGAIQQMPQIVPGMPEVKAKMEEAKAAGKPVPVQRQIAQGIAADVTKLQEIGGLAGRFALAILAVYIVRRRLLLRLFQVPGLFLMPVVFGWAAVTSVNYLTIGMFLAGFVTVAQYSFWGNYLPRVYPLHLRGTGESFAMNIGGRMIGTSFALVTAQIARYKLVPGVSGEAQFAYTAAGVATFAYIVGSIACFFLPEPPTSDEEAAGH
jgi:MFS family permease